MKKEMIGDKAREQRELSNLIELLMLSLTYEDYDLASEWAMDISDYCHRLNELRHDEVKNE